MASTLYKALENIEKGRQACITGARNHGHDIKDTATLQQLADTIFDVGDHIKNTLVPIPELEEAYTFDTDPSRWRRPSDWPDLKTIFTSRTDEEMEGAVIYPHSAFLLDNSKDNFIMRTSGSSVPGTSTGIDLILGASRYRYSYNTNYEMYYRVYTSDGQVYDIHNSDTNTHDYTHTWDASKDINGQYRWIIVYVSGRNEGQSVCVYNAPAVIEGIEVFKEANSYNAWFSPNMVNYEIIPCWTDKQRSLLITKPTALSTISQNNRSKLQMITIDTDDLGYDIQFRYYCAKWTYLKKSGLPYVELSNYNTGHLLGIKSDCNTKISELYYNDMDYGNVKYYPLRYVEGFDLTAINQNTFAVCNLCNVPITDFSWLTNIGAPDCFKHYFKNVKYIDLSKVTSVTYESSIRDLKADVIDLSSLTALNNWGMFDGCVCRKIILDSVESINNSFIWPDGVAEINLPNCKSISGTPEARNSMLIIRLPKLETCSNPDTLFESYRCTKWIELPNNFTQNFNFKNCVSLTSKCKEDIINKAADMTGIEGEHVLTFNSNFYIPEEWHAIANAKNWVIK